MKASRSLTLVGALSVMPALVWFRYLPPPFVGPSVIAAAFFLFAMRRVSSEIGKAVLIGLVTICLVGAAAESYWWLRTHAGPPSVSYPETYIGRDQDLGYAPVKGAVQRLRRTDGPKVIYDVVYSIDSMGLRISHPAPGPALAECVLFFGDSYTIGEGVPDTAAMPYRVAQRLAGRYHVYNFGVHGYGPNHMLALLQSGRVRRTVSCAPGYAIYQVIPAHVGRAAGKLGWRGPRYRLEPDGSVRRDGELLPDDPDDLTFWQYFVSQFEKSALLGVIRARIGPEDRRRFLAIVDAAANTLANHFSGIEFHVLMWTLPDSRDGWMIDSLRGRGLTVHPIEAALPEFRTNRPSIQIPGDGHPTAEAHARIAEYITSNIIKLPRSQ